MENVKSNWSLSFSTHLYRTYIVAVRTALRYLILRMNPNTADYRTIPGADNQDDVVVSLREHSSQQRQRKGGGTMDPFEKDEVAWISISVVVVAALTLLGFLLALLKVSL